MSMTEEIPWARHGIGAYVPEPATPAPAESMGGGDGDEPYCYCCLVGTCPHQLTGGHSESAVTEFCGTALCHACVQKVVRLSPARLRVM